MLDYEAVGYAALEMVRENDDPEGKPVLLAHVPVHTLRVHTGLETVRTDPQWQEAVVQAG